MHSRKLGNSGPVVGAIGLGCMGMSAFYEGRSDRAALETVSKAIDIGVTLIDTADMYAGGTNEILVGQALSNRRHEVVLATKFGQTWAASGLPNGVCGRPDYVQAACEASLKRLNTDHIDLYFQHRVDPLVPIEDTVGVMGRLVEQGKVRFLGLCEAKPETIERASTVHSIAAYQGEYSLWSRDPENGVLETTRRLGIGFVAYSPIGRGFLSGTIRSADDLAAGDSRHRMPRFQGANLDENYALLSVVRDVAEEQGCTAAQVAIAWVLARGTEIVPIPGTKRLAYLEQNCASERVSLSEKNLALLDQVFKSGIAKGTRYPDAAMKALGH